MIEEDLVPEANKIIEDEMKKLINSMSGLNVEHARVLNVCYADYFERKVQQFKEIEKHMRILVRSFYTKARDPQESVDVHKYHEEFVFSATECFECILEEGFGVDLSFKSNKISKECQSGTKTSSNESEKESIVIEPPPDKKDKNDCDRESMSDADRKSKRDLDEKFKNEPDENSQNEPNKRTTAKATVKSTSRRGDNFCDFILKNDNCDNGMKVLGYGVKIPKITKRLANDITTAEHNYTKDTESTESPKTDKSENDVETIEIDEENPFETFPCYHHNSNFPPRLRFKRNLSLMGKSETADKDDVNHNVVKTKRRREKESENL